MEQFVRDPAYYKNNDGVNQDKYAFKRVEVEHMAGIVPLQKTNEYGLKNRILRYNENAIDIYNDPSLHSTFLYLDDSDIEYSFFREQYDFILSLSEQEQTLLNMYSDDSGYKVLALVTKHKDDSHEFLGNAIKRYGGIIKILKSIFGDHTNNYKNSYNIYKSDPEPVYNTHIPVIKNNTNNFFSSEPAPKPVNNPISRFTSPLTGLWDGGGLNDLYTNQDHTVQHFTNFEEYMKAHSEWQRRMFAKEEKTKEREMGKTLEAAILGLKYFEGMTAIFRKAPVVKKQMRVFRGIKVDRDPLKNGYIPDLFYGFISTSYDPEKTVGFTQEIVEKRGEVHQRKCCVFDILVQPGVRAIWLSPLSDFHTTVKEGQGFYNDLNDRSNTEREVILYCDETIQTKFSPPKLKSLLNEGRENNLSIEFISYDIILGLKPKPTLKRMLGQRRLLGGDRKHTSTQKRKDRKKRSVSRKH